MCRARSRWARTPDRPPSSRVGQVSTCQRPLAGAGSRFPPDVHILRNTSRQTSLVVSGDRNWKRPPETDMMRLAEGSPLAALEIAPTCALVSCDGAPRRIGLEEYIGIGEEQPV